MGVVVRRYIDFIILLIPTPLVSVLFCSSIPTLCSFKKFFFLSCNTIEHHIIIIVIHTFNLCKVQSMDDNCGEWVECMCVASGCC